MSAAPLRSIRVLDLSAPVGTYCTRLLSDLGADVVLVEPPEGDPYRRLGPFRAATSGPDASLAFGYYQAGKRSIALDLDDAADRAALERLGGDADVVVLSPSPARPVPGFDAAAGTLAWAAPDAIVCSITPFGVTGPYARRTATHLTSFAQSGGMWRAGPAGTPPLPLPPNLHWHIASTHAAVAILAALDVRDRVGGQFVDISAQEVEQYQEVLWEAYHFQGLRPGGRSIPIGVPPTGVWQCRDGLFDVAAHQVQHWEAFLELLDHPPELAEPSLADMATRQLIFDGVSEIIASLLAPRSRYELFDRGQKIGLPVGLLNTPAQFVADEQLAARDFFVDLGRAETGPLPAPGPAVRTVPDALRAVDTRAAARRARHRAAGRAPAATLAARGGAARRFRRAHSTGMRVLSLGEFVAGNYTAQILAALGAEVVKIESRSRPSNVQDATVQRRADARHRAVGRDQHTDVRVVLARDARRRNRDGHRRRARRVPPSGRDERRRHRELRCRSDGALGLRVRRPRPTQSAPRHGVVVGLRPHRTACRLPGLRLEHRELHRHRRRVVDQPDLRRLPHRRARRRCDPGRAPARRGDR